MAKKPPINEQTSKTVASKASKILSNPKSAPEQKSVAGSALTQTANKKTIQLKNGKKFYFLPFSNNRNSNFNLSFAIVVNIYY